MRGAHDGNQYDHQHDDDVHAQPPKERVRSPQGKISWGVTALLLGGHQLIGFEERKNQTFGAFILGMFASILGRGTFGACSGGEEGLFDFVSTIGSFSRPASAGKS